jgi:hypothetical protein
MKKVFGFLAFTALVACSDSGVACTEEFRIVSITVNGDVLNKVYTVRKSNNDTIFNDQGGVFGSNTYVVLDDNYLSKLKSQTDDFLFVGEINGSVVIEELFKIRADECHVEYVSGNTDVDL